MSYRKLILWVQCRFLNTLTRILVPYVASITYDVVGLHRLECLLILPEDFRARVSVVSLPYLIQSLVVYYDTRDVLIIFQVFRSSPSSLPG